MEQHTEQDARSISMKPWAKALEGKTVLFVADIYIDGGALSCLIELVRELINTYRMRCIVLTSQRSWVNDELESMGAKTIVTEHDQFLIVRSRAVWKSVAKFALFGLEHVFKYWPAIKRAERQLDFNEVDIVHSNMVRTDLGEALARRHGKLHVCHIREFSFSYFHCMSLRRNPAKWLSDTSDVLIPVSEAVREAWVRRGADSHKMRVVYDGVEAERITACAEALHRETDGDDENPVDRPIKFVFIGGIVAEKGVWEALDALDTVHKSGRDATLDIYGGGIPNAGQELASYTDGAGIDNIVTYHGYDTDVSEKLGLYDVGLVCTKLEGFGRAVIEFNAAGLPVIAANRGALPELVEAGVTGFLYGDDGQTLAGCMMKFCDDRQLVAEMREPARRKAQEFTSARTAEEVVKIYAELLDGDGQ